MDRGSAMENWQFNEAEYQRRMKWYTEARFGMFIHFGLYSIPARGEWVRSIEEMPEEKYYPFFREFNPEQFDAHAWAHAAKEAGMKYMVLTAKHHDGFCLFDSQYTDWKITNTPFGRDLVREYVDAARDEGLKVGLYYSLLDWHHPDYPEYGDRNHPMRNHPECSNEKRDWNRYLEYFHNQIRELCTNYGKIDLLWFDYSYDDMAGEKWGATDLMTMIRKLQPDVIIDNRLEKPGIGGSLYDGHPKIYHGDFVSPEQIIPPEGVVDAGGKPMIWEACVTMNNHWGYAADDHMFKPASMIIRKLVECVSKGGNLLLNVGPDAKGEFPEESKRILKEIGCWMKKNGESIYGCGAATDLPKPDYGRITRKDYTCYFHIYENTVGPLPLMGIKEDQVEKIRCVADGHEIPVSAQWMQQDYQDICFADLGKDPVLPDPIDYCIAVTLKNKKEG